MGISNTISPLGPTQDNWQLIRPVEQPVDAGQTLPKSAEDSYSGGYDLVSTPRASLTASMTAVATQSIEAFSQQIRSSAAISAYQSSMNAKGLYGYQSTLGAPLMG